MISNCASELNELIERSSNRSEINFRLPVTESWHTILTRYALLAGVPYRTKLGVSLKEEETEDEEEGEGVEGTRIVKGRRGAADVDSDQSEMEDEAVGHNGEGEGRGRERENGAGEDEVWGKEKLGKRTLARKPMSASAVEKGEEITMKLLELYWCVV